MPVVPGFRHVPGLHCGSTALADVWRLHGAPLSEAMVFGLGRGAFFYFWREDGPRPVRALYGRSLGLEYDACLAVDAAYTEEREPFGGRIWERLRAHVDLGRAPVAWCDVGRLPYYGAGGSFNGHRLVVAGYGEGDALVADTHFPQLLTLPVPVLTHAMESGAPPVMGDEATWTLFGAPARRTDAAMLGAAIRQAGARMIEDDSGFGGLDGLRAFAAEIANWSEPRLWRAGYQFIEKRGTGGGMFRRLFLAFLREAAAWRGDLAQVSEEVSSAAEIWSMLALEMNERSEREGLPPAEAVRLANEVVAREEAWARTAAALGGP